MKRNLTCFWPAACDCINVAKKKIYSICAMEERNLSQGIHYYQFKNFLRPIILFYHSTLILRVWVKLIICVPCTNVRLIYLCMHIRPGNFVLGAQPTSSVIHIHADWDGTVCLKIPVTTGTSPTLYSFLSFSTSLPSSCMNWSEDNQWNRVLNIEHGCNLKYLLLLLFHYSIWTDL